MRIRLTLTTLLFLAACGGQPTTAPPEATATTPLIVTASVTQAPTPPAPGSTAGAPPATTDAAPAATQPPAEQASPTPAGPVAYGPDNFPADVNPLTGLRVADPALLDRRPLAVKVSHLPRRVRPQAGLSLADLVFNHYAEAGVTRMTAIFLGNAVPRIGSIRSARLIDIVLAESYHAMLVTSGSSQGVLNALARTPFYDRVIAEATGYDECPPLCREGDAASTNNLFTSTDGVWQTADQLGINFRQDLDGMAFAEVTPAGGQPAERVHLDFQLEHNVVEWRYNAAGVYERWIDTDVVGQLAAHTDSVNGQAITAANVVVLFANHVTSDIPEDFGNGGHCGYEIQVWGSGPARLFRDGQTWELTWVRFSQTDVIGFIGPDNQVFAFKPGNTWFEILNLGSPLTFENGVFQARFRGPSQSVGCPTG